MSPDQWQDAETTEVAVEHKPASTSPSTPLRLWLERIGIGLVAAFSLIVPLLFGLLFYLAVTDGLVINANDPLHEIRLWMVQERRGATGLGLTITTPREGATGAQCANTTDTFLKWDGRLRVERGNDYCRCYESRGGQLVELTRVTCP